MSSPQPVAAFDFDGTITKRDTVFPFLASVASWPKAIAAMAAQARHLGSARSPDFRDGVKERVIESLFAGRSASAVAQQGLTYAATLPRMYQPTMLERVGWHRNEGHTLVLVSASLAAYAAPAAEALGFHHTIAVELEADDDVLTGKLARPNVRGPEKERRLRAWLDQRFDNPIELWAYGNSTGDRELLAMAQHPTKV